MNSKERCFFALEGGKIDRVPVFPLLMRFASRRNFVTYRDYVTNGSIMAESQIRVIENFNVDAITGCSDAFRVSADLGGEMVYPLELPPHLSRPIITCESDLNRLRKPDYSSPRSRMNDRTKCVSEMVRNAGDHCLVLGWVDMPFAEACSVCGVAEFMMMLCTDPLLAHKILNFLTGIVIDFCFMQLDAGAPMIGSGDAAASLISPELYREFALPYEQQVIEAVHCKGGLVKLHICGNTSSLLPYMVESGADLYNVDHMVDLSEALEIYNSHLKCTKGNINPVSDMLLATPEQCSEAAKKCLSLAVEKRFMLSPGCEVPAEIPDETFSAFCNSVLL
jgi:MtaA/CmuA family methyltransferase